MLKKKLKIMSLLLALILIFSATFVFAEDEVMPISEDGVVAEDVNQDESTTQDEVQENIESTTQENTYKLEDVYLCQDEVTIDYIVDGNVFIIGKNVTISSQIGGDVFVLAETLNITSSSYIYSNLFAAVETANIDGIVYDSYITGSIINVNGYIYRDIKTACDTLNILGTIGRNAFVSSSAINFSENNGEGNGQTGIINGNLTYSAPNELTLPENAVIGETAFHESNFESSTDIQDYLISLGSIIVLIIAIWLLLLWLSPSSIEKSANNLQHKLLPVIGFGILGLIVLPIIAILLLIMQITVYVSLLLLVIYFILLALSTSVFVITLNKFICNKLNITKNTISFGVLIITGIVLWLLGLVPYIGGFISLASVILGLGIMLTNLVYKNKNKKEDK